MSDYKQRRDQLVAELTPEDRATFDEAHATAGLAMDLAETVYRAREAAGLTQTELARRMGTTQSAIASIEARAPEHRPSTSWNASPARAAVASRSRSMSHDPPRPGNVRTTRRWEWGHTMSQDLYPDPQSPEATR